MKQIKRLPVNCLYLYTYLDDVTDIVCKLYRSRSGKTIYLVFPNSIFSLTEKHLKMLSNKLYDAFESIKSDKQRFKPVHPSPASVAQSRS